MCPVDDLLQPQDLGALPGSKRRRRGEAPEAIDDLLHRVAVAVKGICLGRGGLRAGQVLAVGLVDIGEVAEHVPHLWQELLERDDLEPQRGVQVIELEQLRVELARVFGRADGLERVPCGEDRHLGPRRRSTCRLPVFPFEKSR